MGGFIGGFSSSYGDLWITNGTTSGTQKLPVANAFSSGLIPVFLASDGGASGAFVSEDFTPLNGEVLFSGLDANNSNGLWITDGTAAGTSEVITVGGSGSGLFPSDLTPLNNKVLFNGTDANLLEELWITDGTTAGTSELTSVQSTIDNVNYGLDPSDFTSFGSGLLFDGLDANGDGSLWVTDGTSAGTSELTASHSFLSANAPTDITDLGNGLAIFVGEASDGRTLWVTDGTAAGTSELQPAGEKIGASGDFVFGDPVRFGNEVVFAGQDVSNKIGLWISDGTNAGTSELSTPGASSSGVLSTYETNFFVVGSEVLFEGIDAAQHVGLWVTDGTNAGTSELSIAGASPNGILSYFGPEFVVLGNKMLFEGADTIGGGTNVGLWVTDGTSGGTTELVAGTTDSNNVFTGLFDGVHNPNFTVAGNKVFFVGAAANDYYDLWVSDGTAAGTSEVQVSGAFSAPAPGSIGGLFSSDSVSNPFPIAPEFTVFGNDVLFEGRDASGNIGVWISDGTANGTSELAAVTPYDLTGIGALGLFAVIPQAPAAAEFVELSSGGALTHSGTQYTLDFGTISTATTIQLGVENSATAPADSLAGAFVVSGSSEFANNGFANFSGVAAGAVDSGLSVTLNAASAGTFSETITLDPTDVNGSSNPALAPETLIVSGTVVPCGVGALPANNSDSFVSSGTVLAGDVVSSGTNLEVLSGASTSGSTVSGGGAEDVFGVQSGTVVSEGGADFVEAGGVGFTTQLLMCAAESVESGGIASGTTVNEARQMVYGLADNAVLDSGGVQYVSGGTTTGTTVSNGGYEVIEPAGEADGSTLTSGGYEYVYLGGLVIGAAVSSGAIQNDAGNVANTQLVGFQIIYPNAEADGTVISSPGYQYILPSGLASGTDVALGGIQNVDGSGTHNDVYGFQIIFSEATADFNTIESTGYQYILPGGVADQTVVSLGGIQNDDGTATNTSLGGFQVVFAGATTSNTIIENGGYQYILPGATASNTTLLSGAIQNDDGVADGNTISSGGFQVVFAGATASGTTIETGGFEVVLSGGLTSNATLSGGYLELGGGEGAGSGGIVSFVGGGILKLDDSVHFNGVISGFAQPDQLDLADIAFGSNTTLGFSEAGNNTSGTLTVSDGVHTADILLLGQYVAGNFNIASDGTGGTLVTDPPVTVPTDQQGFLTVGRRA